MARIFNTYGPRMTLDDGRVVTNFGRQALQGAPLHIYGSGSQTRSFCYVDDTVDGLMRLMECNEPVHTMNVGNPDERTILQLAELVLSLTGSPSELTHKPLPDEDPERRCPDISLARRLLGWEPKIPLEEGLRLTLLDVQEQLLELDEPLVTRVAPAPAQ